MGSAIGGNNSLISGKLAQAYGMGNMTSSNKDKQRENEIYIEKRKEKICNDLIDNFDMHFERRKKDLDDNLRKKIS